MKVKTSGDCEGVNGLWQRTSNLKHKKVRFWEMSHKRNISLDNESSLLSEDHSCPDVKPTSHSCDVCSNTTSQILGATSEV